MKILALVDTLQVPHTMSDHGSSTTFERAIDHVLDEQSELTASEFFDRVKSNSPLGMWKYIDATFDPDVCRCTYTCVWRAYEAFYKRECLQLTEIEDRTNACIKWLHEIKTRVAKLEAVDDLVSPGPFAQSRSRFAELTLRLDEITEFVMHKLRCAKFGV